MMKDLASNLPSAEELIRALQGRSNDRELLPGLALFGAGLLVGAGLALLLAPSSGEELREHLGERFGGMMREGSDEAHRREASGTH